MKPGSGDTYTVAVYSYSKSLQCGRVTTKKRQLRCCNRANTCNAKFTLSNRHWVNVRVINAVQYQEYQQYTPEKKQVLQAALLCGGNVQRAAAECLDRAP